MVAPAVLELYQTLDTSSEFEDVRLYTYAGWPFSVVLTPTPKLPRSNVGNGAK
jgi:hypothetical protein